MTALRLLLPVALIGLCLAVVGGKEALQRLAGLSPGWTLFTLALLNAVTVLSALRWRLTATALDLPMPFGEALREYYMAQFVNQTLPGGVLGDAARVARNRRGGPLHRAAQAVVLERAAGQAGMAAVALAGLAAFLLDPQSGPGASELPTGAWLAAAVSVLLLSLGLLLSRGRARPAGWGAAFRRAIVAQLPSQALLSLSIAILTVTAFATAARASGSLLPAGTATMIVPLILTAMLLPASLAGWGWREGAAAALFPLSGLSAEAGLAASIAFGACCLFSALPGAFFLRRPTPPPAPARASIVSPRE